MAKLNAKQIPIDYMPTTGEVDKYLHQWDDLENYVNQEKALDKLFFQLCKTNVDLSDILIKCSALNDFYSTNIFDIHSVAKHIFRIPRIDERLVQGDLSLIDEISHVEVGKDKKEHCFYSFVAIISLSSMQSLITMSRRFWYIFESEITFSSFKMRS